MRFPYQGRHVHVINVSEYAWNNGDKEQLLLKRDKIWSRLDRLITSIPFRNTLLLGGDFNCVGTSDRRRFGPAMNQGQNPHADRMQLANIAQVHQLTALNAWGRRSRWFTFSNDPATSQKDFLFMRQVQLDGAARQAQPDHGFHVLRWRRGAHNHPVYASIPAVHFQSAPQPTLPKFASSQPEAWDAASPTP